MHASTILSRFEVVLSTWEKALDNYSEADFTRQPASDAWSIGQVYQHLIGSAQRFYLKQAEACLASSENASAAKTMPGRISFFLGGFLPVRVKVPPSPQYTPPQPESIAQIRSMIPPLRKKMAALAQQLSEPHNKGKTAHPMLGYLSALEWFALVEMHYRHHLRQKKRIDAFLTRHQHEKT